MTGRTIAIQTAGHEGVRIMRSKMRGELKVRNTDLIATYAGRQLLEGRKKEGALARANARKQARLTARAAKDIIAVLAKDSRRSIAADAHIGGDAPVA